eukprot:2347510-Pyramimonas_sp.AAC.1
MLAQLQWRAQIRPTFRLSGPSEAAQRLPLDRTPQRPQKNAWQHDLLCDSRTGCPWCDPWNSSSKMTMPAGT